MRFQLTFLLLLLVVAVAIAKRSQIEDGESERGHGELQHGHHGGGRNNHQKGKRLGHHKGKHWHHKGKRHSFTKEKECQILMGMVGTDWAIPTCSAAVGKCFQESHKLAGICIRKEKTDSYIKQCQKLPNVKALKFEWFAKSCLWHQAIVNCSAANPVSAVITEMVSNLTEATLGSSENQYEARTAHHECWATMEAKLGECNALAAEQCTNFATCSGVMAPPSDAPELSKQWYQVSSKLRAAKTNKLSEFKQAIIQCISELPTSGPGEADSSPTESSK